MKPNKKQEEIKSKLSLRFDSKINTIQSLMVRTDKFSSFLLLLNYLGRNSRREFFSFIICLVAAHLYVKKSITQRLT